MANLLSTYRGLPSAVYYLFIGRLINAMGFFVYPLLTLILTQKIGMSVSEAGLYVSLITVTQAPCLIIGGKLADHMGRKRVAVTAGIISGLFYLICGFTGAGHSLIWFLMLAADFDVIGIPAWDALLADHTAPQIRQRAYSLMYLAVNLGMTISPILAGFLFNDHLAIVFIFDATTTILCNLTVLWKVPESYPHAIASPGDAAARSDAGEGASGSAGASASKGTSTSAGASASKAAAGPSSATRQTLFHILRGLPVLVTFVLLLFVFDFCYIQWQFTLPAECGTLFGNMSARYYSMLSSENALVCILLTPLLTTLTSRLRPLVAVGIGGVAYTVAYLGLSLSNTFPAFLVFGAIFTSGEVMCAIQNGAFIANRSPREFRGRINAFVYFVRGASEALSPAIMGLVLAASSYQVSWFVGVVLAGCATVGMFLLNRREKSSKDASSTS